MDADYGVDLNEIRRVVDEAEVFIVRFTHLDRRLLVDARSADEDPPMIRIVRAVSSAAERYRELEQLRPKMSLPEQITVFTWPKQSKALRDSGIWGLIEARLVGVGGFDLGRECEVAFDELVAAERAEILAAIRGGEGFETLWERNSSS